MFGIFGSPQGGGSPGGGLSPGGYDDLQQELANQKSDVDMEQMMEMTKKLKEAGAEGIKEAMKAWKNAITPGFVKRYQNAKIYTKKMADADSNVDKMFKTNKKQSKEEYKVFQKEKMKTQRYHDTNVKMKHQIELEDKQIKEAKNYEKNKQLDDFKARRKIIASEAKAIVDNQLFLIKEKKENDIQKLRDFRQTHWSKQAIINRNESNALLLSRDEMLKEEYSASIKRMSSDWTDREISRARLQVEGPGLSDPIGLPGGELGIFGKPLGPGAYDGNFENSGHIAGADDFDVHVFSSDPYSYYESKNIDVYDLDSELKAATELYAALQQDTKYLSDAIFRIKELQDASSIDVHQLQQEIKTTEIEQLSPPRRMPVAKEIETVHIRKTRIAKINKKMEQFQHTATVAEEKKKMNNTQMLSLAKQIAILKTKISDVKNDMYNENYGDNGMLPIVVGRNISKVPGIGPNSGKPNEFYQAVKQKSKIIGIKDMSKLAIKAHKERVTMDQELWLERQTGTESKLEVELVMSKLADIQNSLKEKTIQTWKVNLYEAIDAFIKSKIPLNKVRVKYAGIMQWWKYRNMSLCSNVDRFVSDSTMGGISFELDDPNEVKDESFSHGVTLGNENQGFCAGIIKMPKLALWTILISISRAYTKPLSLGTSAAATTAAVISSTFSGDVDDDSVKQNNVVGIHGDSVVDATAADDDDVDDVGYDETDFVAVNMGLSSMQMQYIGTYFNRVNPDTGSVLYDIKYTFRGDQLAYRFDFSSSSKDPRKHLAVGTGLYEEFEMKDIEVIIDPITGKSRVLSSYVKLLKIDELQGKYRLSKLIEELIEIEASAAINWDSEIINHYGQRYNRLYFQRILRAEILCEAKKAEDLQQLMLLEHPSAVADDADDEYSVATSKLSKAAKSAKRFLLHKQQLQQQVVDDGINLTHKRIEVFDESSQKWRHITTLSYRLQWIENGNKPLITHVIQEYDDYNEKVGTELEIDLKQLRHFVSPNQDVDHAAIARQYQQRVWDNQIREMDRNHEQRLIDMRVEYDQLVKHEGTKLRQLKEKMSNKFTKTIDRYAEESIRTPTGMRSIKNNLVSVLLDMKRGLIPLRDDMKPKEQADMIAEQRYLASYKEDRRKDLDARLADMDDDYKDMIVDQLKVMESNQVKLQSEYNTSRYKIKHMMEQQKKREKELFLKKVKFNPEIFSLATPKSMLCQHLVTKAWGNNYGKGTKCVQCGKEVSDLHKEESQILGYGTGCTAEFYEQLKRHRENEMSYRFKKPGEVELLEKERLHLDKERREMELQDEYFYDFEDLHVLYDIDRRHAQSIKERGVFRQGLQWKPEEIELYQARILNEEKDRLRNEGLLEAALDGFDPLSKVQEPPPTFRAQDERRRAQYKDLMYGMGRLHNYQKKISQLKDVRLENLGDRNIYNQVLEYLHKESYGFDRTLGGIEDDIIKTDKLLSTYEKMSIMWNQAKRILREADIEKKKCEMRHCGVIDDVEEAQLKASFLHDETRSLLKVKFLIDTKLESNVKLLDSRTVSLHDATIAHADAERHSYAMKCCIPGDPVFTRYGYGYVRVYRPDDGMLLVTLPFGRPCAKLWIHYQEIVHTERAKQHGERVLMEMEDDRMSKYLTHEAAKKKKEMYLMAQEERGLRKFYEKVDLDAKETDDVSSNVTAAVNEAYAYASSVSYNKLVNSEVQSKADQYKQRMKHLHDTYRGPPSGRPKIASYADIRAKKKETQTELMHSFLLKFATSAAKSAINKSVIIRKHWVISNCFDLLIEQTIDSMIQELCKEAHLEGRIAKTSSEKSSGLYFPHPPWMQYGTYLILSDLWKDRKEELKLQIELNKGHANKVSKAIVGNSDVKNEYALSNAEIAAKRERKRLVKIERLRQRNMCAEMYVDECAVRVFYKWELGENLRERRDMRDDEVYTRMFYKEEKKLLDDAVAKALARKGADTKRSVAATVSASAVVVDVSISKEDQAALAYDKRRKELKDLTMERRKRVEEEAYMTLEDELSEKLREVDRKDRAKAAFLKEFGNDAIDPDADAGGDDVLNEQDLSPVVFPEWYRIPQAFDEWDLQTQKKHINFMTDIHNRQVKIDSKVTKDEWVMQKLEDKSYTIWSDLYSVIEQKEMEAELSLMYAQEEKKMVEASLMELQENMRKIMVFCREKGEEELKAKSDLRKKQEVARKRTQELKDATQWYDLCLKRSKQRDKLKRRVVESCLYIDTDSINGFHQRYETVKLRARLYEDYFHQIAISIANKAEIIATERRLFKIQENLTINKMTLIERSTNMNRQWKDIQRNDIMRLRKSKLNERFFPKHRRATLMQRFSSWVRYYYWNRGHREAYELKYEVLKRQLDINRQFKQQLLPSSHPENAAVVNGVKRQDKNAIQTIMSKHQLRPVQCSTCSTMYLEAQNHSMACSYHNGVFGLACPQTCMNPGLTPMCQAHRCRRWKCCDQTREDSLGCLRQYHSPKDDDMIYSKMMSLINKRDHEFLSTVEEKLVVARKENWAKQLFDLKRGQVVAIEDKFDKERATAARYHTLKWDHNNYIDPPEYNDDDDDDVVDDA